MSLLLGVRTVLGHIDCQTICHFHICGEREPVLIMSVLIRVLDCKLAGDYSFSFLVTGGVD